MTTIFLKGQLQLGTPFSHLESVCLRELLPYLAHFYNEHPINLCNNTTTCTAVPNIITTNKVDKMNIHLECKE